MEYLDELRTEKQIRGFLWLLCEGTADIIRYMKKDLAPEHTLVAEMLKTIGSLKPSSLKLSTMSTTSTAKP